MWVGYPQAPTCKPVRSAETLALSHLLGWWNGRHVRLRGVCRKACGFKSRPEHIIPTSINFAERATPLCSRCRGLLGRKGGITAGAKSIILRQGERSDCPQLDFSPCFAFDNLRGNMESLYLVGIAVLALFALILTVVLFNFFGLWLR